MLASAVLVGEVLEAGMLVAFGVSWPVDVMKTLRTRRTEGKSIAFMSLVFCGYVLGMSSKLAKAAGGEPVEWVIALYIFNAVIIAVDIAVTMRMRRKVVGNG